jgi:hypothetical protein
MNNHGGRTTVRQVQPPAGKGAREAKKLRKLGYWAHLIHPDEKRPIGKAWGAKPWDEARIDQTAGHYPDAGVGVALGPDRAPTGEWLIDLEGDGDQAADSLARLLGGEVPHTPSWSATRGDHALFTADGPRLQKALIAAGAVEGTDEKGKGAWHLPEFPGLEFRIGGYKSDGKTVKQVQSVVPPTPGTDGNPRTWNVQPSTPVAPLSEATYVVLETIGAEKAREARPEPRKRKGKAVGRRGDSYATAALRGECAAVEAEPEGCRNKRLNTAAYNLGQLVGARQIARSKVESALTAAARKAGLGDGETAATIKSGLDAGEAQPRDMSGVGSRSRRYGAPPSVNGEARPDVEISTRRYESLEAMLAILPKDPDLYCRGGSLGTVIREQTDTAILPGGVELLHAQGNLRFLPIASSVLGCRLTRLAAFFCWRKDPSGESFTTNCHPPDWLISAVADHQYWPGVPHLLTIADVPWVRADGSIPSPGFDRATRTLYVPSITIPKIPDRPTKKDVLEALDVLVDLVIQFPFEADDDRWVWLADVLTGIQRPLIAGPTPGFAYSGNAAGVGKGLLIDLGGIIVHGCPIGTSTYPLDPKEAEKVKLALALAAVPSVHFDNLSEGGFYGGGVVDSMLTSTVVSGRILGQSRDSGNVPLRTTWHVSGNNISPIKDSARRWLPSNLVTKLECPYERDDLDEDDLKGATLRKRPALVHAALIILRAHALAGQPTGTKDGKRWAPLGSFESWDRIIRGAIHYATGKDVLTTQRKAAAEQPDRTDKAGLLAGWLEIDPQRKGMTIEEVLDAVRDDMEVGKKKNTPPTWPVLKNALLALSRDSKLPSVDQVKYKIRSMRKTPINRMRFESCDDTTAETRSGAKSWKVVAC